MAHCTVVSCIKGGVGKTRLTVDLAAALARDGFGVLVIDMDPQANATRRLGIDPELTNSMVTMSEVLKSGQDGVGEGAVIQCGWVDDAGESTAEAQLIDLMPSRFDLVNRETEAGQVGAVRRLRKVLKDWSDDYDVILIDTPPSLGHLTQMALAAADSILIPAEASYDGVEAAMKIRDFAALHAEDLANPALRVGGVLVQRYRRTEEEDEQIRGLNGQFPGQVWNPSRVATTPKGKDILVPRYVPEWTRFNAATGAAASLSAWNDQRADETVALFDSIAAIFKKELLERSAA